MRDFNGWDLVPVENATNYAYKCKLLSSSDELFNNFRQDPDYKKILEGGERVVGDMHLDRIIKRSALPEFIEHLDEFKENDLYGNPSIHHFNYVGDICPCTIMYVSNALEIKKEFGNDIKKIVEIGGGFGGLCKTLSVLYDFDEYVMVDLPEAILLAKKYLSHFPDLYKKITFVNAGDFEEIKNIDLFIAVSSLSECNEAVQNNYIDKAMMNARYGYMCYNTLHVEGLISIYAKILLKLSKAYWIRTDRDLGVEFLFLTRKDFSTLDS